jgi:hypothetical protein
MNLTCLLTFRHRYRPVPSPTSGFLRERCERCGKLRVKVAPPLIEQVAKRLDLDPNPKYWTAGPGVSAIGQVGVENPWLQRGYANEELEAPETNGERSN